MPRKTNPGRKLISLEAKEAGPEVSKQELLWKSGGTEISSLRKLMQEGVQLFREGLVDGTVTDDYSSYNSRQQSCPDCLSMSSFFRHYRKYGVVEMNPSHLSSPRAHSCCHVLLQGWCIHECPLLPANTHQQHPAVVQHRGQAGSMGHERRSDAGTLCEKAALFMSM